MPLCPDCGAEVERTDTHCMECGADLIEAREKERRRLREQSLAGRTSGGNENPAATANAGARGVMGIGEKSSEETRLRVFDREEAKRLKQERLTAWVTAGLALLGGIALAIIGYTRIKAGGGFGGILPAFTPAALRTGSLETAITIGTLLAGSGLSGLLVGIGQIRLARAATRAIADVQHNRKPEIAQVSGFTLLGLLLLSIFCPPLGVIIGAIMRFGRNPDLTDLGGRMMIIGIGLMVLVGLNFVWGMIGADKAAAEAKEAAGG